jgi:hypothetical protein
MMMLTKALARFMSLFNISWQNCSAVVVFFTQLTTQ